jgi:hypothetical protein
LFGLGSFSRSRNEDGLSSLSFCGEASSRLARACLSLHGDVVPILT